MPALIQTKIRRVANISPSSGVDFGKLWLFGHGSTEDRASIFE